MTTTEKILKLEDEVAALKKLVSNLVPFDNEGEYKKSFIASIQKAKKEKVVMTFQGKGSLLGLAK